MKTICLASASPFTAFALATVGSLLLPSDHVWAAFPQLKLEVVCDRQIHSPVAMTHAGDGSGRSFIADQRGKIYVFQAGVLLPTPFLDLGAKLVPERANFDERGLLGLAFHPGYGVVGSPGHRRFYVFYTAPSPNAPGISTAPVDSRSVVAEYLVSATDPTKADLASERILLSFDKPQFNHNGGGLEFGPDGFLYFSVGDGGSSNDNNFGHTGGGGTPRPTNAKGNAQDLTKWHGKLHRIDPLGSNGSTGQYGIPASNPFASSPNGERPEIYAWGLRNMWRFTFDGGRVYGADVGQGQVEEIDLITLGGNYGWRNKEGSFIPPFSVDAPAMSTAATDPIAQYAHPGIVIGSPVLPQWGLSITGGYVYRGTAIPALVGKYVFGDWSGSFNEASGRMLGMEELTPGVFTLSQLNILGGNPMPYFIQGFGRDGAGEIYVLARDTPAVTRPNAVTGLPAGVILKLVPVPATTTLSLTANKDNTLFQEGSLSNGTGEWIFAGATEAQNNAAHRRALLGWSMATVPAGATIASAEVALKMDRTIAPAYDFSLHKMSGNWGEGTANATGPEGDGIAASATDATWLKPFSGQVETWATPGGDFLSAKSATTSVNATGSVAGGVYRWNAAGLASDVQSWLADPSSNFGWLLKVDVEAVKKASTGAAAQPNLTVADTDGLVDGMVVQGTGVGSGAKIAVGGINTTTKVVRLTLNNTGAVNSTLIFGAPTAKRFVSKNAALATSRPQLILKYVPAPPAPTNHRTLWELANYYKGQYINDAYDTDRDGITDGLEYAWGFRANAAEPMSSGFSVITQSQSPVTITFRRDTLATTLTYRAVVSTDLTNFTTLAVSIAGAAPTGAGFVSEVPVVDAPNFRTVTVHHTPAANAPRSFYSLQVVR